MLGILTFFRVYNYGAVLQAYCLQAFLGKRAVITEIIDYSQVKQKDYTDILSIHNGKKRFIKTLMLLPVLKRRLIRKDRFDKFIESELILSSKKYSEKNLKEANDMYSGYIVGSDQVWNTTKKAEMSSAYFLDFAENDKTKISYASSIGVAEMEDLLPYRSFLLRFNSLSCREKTGCNILEKLLDREVKSVLDPTLIIDKSLLNFKNISIEHDNEKYILYYSLNGFDKRRVNMDILAQFARKFSLKLKIITPEWPFHSIGEEIIDAGPIEFVELIKHATLVCTTSFHGTALAIRFNVPFFVLEGKNIRDRRKRDLLTALGIQSRIISTIKEANNIETYEMHFESINQKLNELQNESIDYLLSAIYKTGIEKEH